jgi:hypothetical protein
MATPYHHAVSSAKKHGGTWDQYIDIHNWFDETKAWVGDIRHRAFRHHSEGIFECEQKFGVVTPIILESGLTKNVPTRVIAEQHVQEDCGFIPSAKEYFDNFKPTKWMLKVGRTLHNIDNEEDGTR